MTLYGFSREDVARQLSHLAKKDLIANYPDGSTTPPGLSEYVQGQQTGVDPEFYLFYSNDDIPAAVEVPDPDGEPNDIKLECGSTAVPQRVYKPRIRPSGSGANPNYNKVGQPVDAVRIATFDDSANARYATAKYFVYNPWDRPIRKKEIGVAAVIGGVLFALQRPPSRRIRFRLKTNFDDKGFATAEVLDAWNTKVIDDVESDIGEVDVCYGRVVTVTDPRKLFAHAVGSVTFDADVHQKNPNMDDMLHAGGSVGYAIETWQIDDCNAEDPFDCLEDCQEVLEERYCYPRFEVEQCTQTVNKMRVEIDRYSSFPQGISSTETKDLLVNPQQSFASQWPYVDYPTNLIVTGEAPNVEYRLRCLNPHRFSAKQGWAIIERVDYPSRVQNAKNRCVPYPSMGVTRDEEWHIVDVENPIARYICANYTSSGSWTYAGSYFEGEDPQQYFVDSENPSSHIDDHIETVSCLTIDCLNPGEYGVAFWDPNNQKYYVFSTVSALYGRATDYELVGQRDGGAETLIQYAQNCALEYKVRSPVKVFGDHPSQCPATTETRTTSPTLTGVDVLTNVTRANVCEVGGTVDPTITDESACTAAGGTWKPSEEICFDKKVVFVCDDEDTEDVCVNVCCDDGPTPPPPESPCIDCQSCPEAYIEFGGFTLIWSNVPTGNGNFGGRDKGDAVFTQGSGDCCVNLAVTLESDDPLVADQAVTATVCIAQADGNCSGANWQLELTWSQQTYAGVTLPTHLCGGPNFDCAGNYGSSQGSGIVPALPNTTSGTWDESNITVTGCTP